MVRGLFQLIATQHELCDSNTIWGMRTLGEDASILIDADRWLNSVEKL